MTIDYIHDALIYGLMAAWPAATSFIASTSYSTLSRVSTEMGDRSRVYRLRIQPSHPGQLSLAIPLWLDSIGDGYRHC